VEPITDAILQKSLQQKIVYNQQRGGAVRSEDVFVWNQESKFPVNGRSNHTALLHRDRLYIFGGLEK
jgi:hypothetical protein